MLRSIGLAVVIALTLLPLVAEAQAGGVRRIGFLGAAGPGSTVRMCSRFATACAMGWVDGQTLTIEYRWAQGIRSGSRRSPESSSRSRSTSS